MHIVGEVGMTSSARLRRKYGEALLLSGGGGGGSEGLSGACATPRLPEGRADKVQEARRSRPENPKPRRDHRP